MKKLNSLFKPTKRAVGDAPVPHLVQSNLPPTDVERKLISSAILAAQSELDLLSNQESSPSTTPKIAQWTDFIQTQKSCLSCSIPPEILIEIFEYTARLNPGWMTRPGGYITLPWNVTQVSRKWRTTAIDVPSLWTHFPAINLHKKLVKSSSFATLLNEVLGRSRGQPLSLYIAPPFRNFSSHPVIDILVLQAERWAVITFQTTPPTLNAFSAAEGRLESLHTLTLDMWDETNSYWEVRLFKCAPKLRDVKVVGRCPADLSLPWRQLTVYKEDARKAGALMDVLGFPCPLEELEIRASPYHPAHIPYFTFPKLKILRLRMEGITRIEWALFFCALKLPSIQEIMIYAYPRNVLPTLTSMFYEPLCQAPSGLQKLCLRSGRQPGELADLLCLLPDLLELEVDLPPSEDLSRMVITDRTPILVPMLTKLILHMGACHIPAMESTLSSIALSRCQTNLGTLRTFRVVFPNRDACFVAQEILNHWQLSDLASGQSRASLLSAWNETLHEELPELHECAPPGTRALDLKFVHRLDRWLTNIENYQLEDAQVVHASGLHFSLRGLSELKPDRIPGDKKYQFRSRAAQILKKWEPILVADLRHRAWGLKGTQSLVYVAEHDELRDSPRVVDMIYGIEEDVPDDDLFWDSYL